MSFINFPYYGKRIGQFGASMSSGILAATLAADAPIFGIRNGPTQPTTPNVGNIPIMTTKVYITEFWLRVSSVVAFTAPQQFGLYLARYSAANLAGGAAVNPFKLHSNSATSVDSVCKPGGTQAGDVRVATTAALTTAGVTIDPNKLPVYSWTTVGPAEYPEVWLQLVDNPIHLDPGEGVALFNTVVWPAAGTAIVGGSLFWDEALV